MTMLINWGYMYKVIDTAYGRLTYWLWIRKEKERIEASSNRKLEVVKKGNRICLMEHTRLKEEDSSGNVGESPQHGAAMKADLQYHGGFCGATQ